MKISYITQASAKIEVVSEIETLSKRLGSTGEHLAYAIAQTQKLAMQGHKENKSAPDLNAELKNTFYSCMNESTATSAMLHDLPPDFDFTAPQLVAKLTQIFVVNGISPETVTDQRIVFHIPECPIYLAPITFGIKLNNDPNWYEIDAVYKNIFAYERQSSPMTNHRWSKVEEVREFNQSDAESKLNALYQLREIKRYFSIRQQIDRSISLSSGQHAFFNRPPAQVQVRGNLGWSTENLLGNFSFEDPIQKLLMFITFVELLTSVVSYTKNFNNGTQNSRHLVAQLSFIMAFPIMFRNLSANISLLETGFRWFEGLTSNDNEQYANVLQEISEVLARVQLFFRRNGIADAAQAQEFPAEHERNRPRP